MSSPLRTTICFICLLAAAIAFGAQTPAPAVAGQNYAVGVAPYFVAVGHLDGADNGADLIVTNYNDNSLSILLNQGDGTFQAARTYPLGKAPTAVAVADFTGTGRRDLAVALLGQDTLALLLNKGNGEFQEPKKYSVIPAPGSLAVGDFNRDGRDDVLVASLTATSASLLLSKDADDFAAPQKLELGYVPFFVAAADLNGDGNTDFITCPWQRTGPTQLGLYAGKGNGAFAEPKRLYAGQNAYQVAAGDFNHDGKLDLVTANNFSRGAHVLAGTGDGNFQTATNFPIGDCGAVVTGDFNGDGLLDFAVTNSVTAKVTILLGDGAGQFPTRQDFAVGRGPVMLAVADFDRDGKRDLVTVNQTANNVTILLGKTLEFAKAPEKPLLLPE
jgi:hypothetical protein